MYRPCFAATQQATAAGFGLQVRGEKTDCPRPVPIVAAAPKIEGCQSSRASSRRSSAKQLGRISWKLLGESPKSNAIRWWNSLELGALSIASPWVENTNYARC